MEPKEQQPKHTAEPWILHNDNQHDQTHKSGWFCGDDKPFGYLLSEEDFNHAAKCVNALEGKTDPEFYVKNADKLIKIAVESAPFKTACESINPDNPMAVAESLKSMRDLLNEAKTQCDYNSPLRNDIEELLTKIQQA